MTTELSGLASPANRAQETVFNEIQMTSEDLLVGNFLYQVAVITETAKSSPLFQEKLELYVRVQVYERILITD